MKETLRTSFIVPTEDMEKMLLAYFRKTHGELWGTGKNRGRQSLGVFRGIRASEPGYSAPHASGYEVLFSR